MSNNQRPLDKFGRFLVTGMRDPAVDFFDGVVRGQWKSPERLDLHSALSALDDQQLALVRRCVVDTLDTAIGKFLGRLEQRADFEGDIQITVDGEDVVQLSDGLGGEPYGKRGWIARFSRFGAPSPSPEASSPNPG